MIMNKEGKKEIEINTISDKNEEERLKIKEIKKSKFLKNISIVGTITGTLIVGAMSLASLGILIYSVNEGINNREDGLILGIFGSIFLGGMAALIGKSGYNNVLDLKRKIVMLEDDVKKNK